MDTSFFADVQVKYLEKYVKNMTREDLKYGLYGCTTNNLDLNNLEEYITINREDICVQWINFHVEKGKIFGEYNVVDNGTSSSEKLIDFLGDGNEPIFVPRIISDGTEEGTRFITVDWDRWKSRRLNIYRFDSEDMCVRVQGNKVTIEKEDNSDIKEVVFTADYTWIANIGDKSIPVAGIAFYLENTLYVDKGTAKKAESLITGNSIDTPKLYISNLFSVDDYIDAIDKGKSVINLINITGSIKGEPIELVFYYERNTELFMLKINDRIQLGNIHSITPIIVGIPDEYECIRTEIEIIRTILLDVLSAIILPIHKYTHILDDTSGKEYLFEKCMNQFYYRKYSNDSFIIHYDNFKLQDGLEVVNLKSIVKGISSYNISLKSDDNSWYLVIDVKNGSDKITHKSFVMDLEDNLEEEGFLFGFKADIINVLKYLKVLYKEAGRGYGKETT